MMERSDRPGAETFVKALTGAGTATVSGCLSFIAAGTKLSGQLETAHRNPAGRLYYSWGIGIGSELAAVVYTLCYLVRPEIVVETGVGSGVSSSYILYAMETAGRGDLYSIDLPAFPGTPSGWLVPDELRPRWHLVQGRTSEELAPLLDRLGAIDIFFHDSEHSYKNMYREFQTAWGHLRTGGLLLSHNIDMSRAFRDFCRDMGVVGHIFGDTGGIVKP